MKKSILFLSSLLIFSTVFTACKDDDDDTAAILALSTNKQQNIIFGETITLSANSTGNTYIWTCEGGSIVGNGKTATWTAPYQAGSYKVVVSNGKNSEKQIYLSVIGATTPKGNISYLSASKTANILLGEEITLNATSDENALIWNKTGGNLTGEGKSVKWTADKVGEYTITVSNGEGSEKSVTLNVVGSYFYLFDKSGGDWSRPTETTSTVTSGGFVTVTAKGTDYAQFRYLVPSQPEIPFSYKTKVAITSDSYLTGSENVNFYIWFTEQEGGSNFLRSVFFSVNPNQKKWLISVGTKSNAGSTGTMTYTRQTLQDATIFSGNNQFKNIGLAITENKELVVNVEGNEIYRLDLSSYSGNFKLDYMQYYVSPNISLVIDDFYLTNDGTILK